jgi:hypothetical protein
MKNLIKGLANKFKIATVLAVLLILVLINNLTGRIQINNLEQSFSAMYRDRLLAESYLLQLIDLIYQKEKLVEQCSLNQFNYAGHNSLLNENIRTLVNKYEMTTLTSEEDKIFKELKSFLVPIQHFDNKIDNHVIDNPELIEEYLLLTRAATGKLLSLSQIQTDEGSRLINKTNHIIMNQRSTSYFEVVILVFLGVIIQTLVLSSSALHEKMRKFPNLN